MKPAAASAESEPSLSQGVELTVSNGDDAAPAHVEQQETDNGDRDASSTESSSSSYEDPSDNDLGMLQAAALLTADCLGTGLLALPQDVKVLGHVVGLGFLIVNLPINLYAGTILSNAAAKVELEQEQGERTTSPPDSISIDRIEQRMNNGDGIVRVGRKTESAYSTVSASQDETGNEASESHENQNHTTVACMNTVAKSQKIPLEEPTGTTQIYQHHHLESFTYDFIGMTQELFHHPLATHLVMAFYYTNIFLVLGDYILVMSHAVAATIGEDLICLPVAGVLASTLMFAFSQLRTMANLGRSATVLSLSSLAIVVTQCLVATNQREYDPERYIPPEDSSPLRKLSSLASIGFAVGSQKLFLNIRHEMKRRKEAPKSLGTSLSVFGTAYVVICLLAGPDPPSFLFDAIPPGLNRRIAGLLLWIHVAVSYAINSQAICSSMDRLFAHRIDVFGLRHSPKRRWILLTLLMAVSSYLVANAVPFFKDLVALIGALTSVPLTLIIPAVLYRRICGVPLWCPTRHSIPSYGLILFGLMFLVAGLAGSLGSIELDWTHRGSSFSCKVIRR